MNCNMLLDVDSYKPSQWLQYPPNSGGMFSYMESRGGTYKKTVWFGPQYLTKEYLCRPITRQDVVNAAAFMKKHGVPFNVEGWHGIVRDHGGYLPMSIRALPEGTVVPTGLPLLTCESTDPKYFWVVGYFETQIMRLWYGTTVATLSYHVKQVIKQYLSETADDLSGLPFKLHDFGARGVSSRESAAIGGAAHLVNFMGSDTIAGIDLANTYYHADMAGFSIPASEHSTITSWGGPEHELEAFDNMVNQFAQPGKIFAVVSDSYDIYNAVDHLWGEKLRQKVIDSGATLVVRPDSGEPVFVVNKVLHLLRDRFGAKVNSKGYLVLNNVRVIQGDGCTPETIEAILKSVKLAGFSTDNIAFGMGGGLLQQVNRDTQKMAYKCSAIKRNDTWLDVSKNPVTDPGKKSKAGRLGTKKVDGKFVVTTANDPDNLLIPIFENGIILNPTTFAEIRARSEGG